MILRTMIKSCVTNSLIWFCWLEIYKHVKMDSGKSFSLSCFILWYFHLSRILQQMHLYVSALFPIMFDQLLSTWRWGRDPCLDWNASGMVLMSFLLLEDICVFYSTVRFSQGIFLCSISQTLYMFTLKKKKAPLSTWLKETMWVLLLFCFYTSCFDMFVLCVILPLLIGVECLLIHNSWVLVEIHIFSSAAKVPVTFDCSGL